MKSVSVLSDVYSKREACHSDLPKRSHEEEEVLEDGKDPGKVEEGKEKADVENTEEVRREEREELEKHVPAQYRDFLDVFSPGEAKELPPHCPYNICINTEGDAMPPIGKLYNM